MTWFGLALGALGVLDLVRWNRDRLDGRTILGLAAAGVYVLALLVLGDVAVRTAVATSVVAMLLGLAWVLGSDAALHGGKAARPGLAIALAILVIALLLSPYSPDLAGPLEEWYDELPWAPLLDVSIERALVVLGSALALTCTGNVLVRLVLEASGSKVQRSEQQIKGGRVLGPLERLLILGLGLAGELGAASIIVAAKGLLRFPELQSYRAEEGEGGAGEASAQRIDVLTEYFLIGSMTSWVLALLGLAIS